MWLLLQLLLRVFPLFVAAVASSSPIFPLVRFAASAPLLSCCSLSGSSFDSFSGDREGGGGEGEGETEDQSVFVGLLLLLLPSHWDSTE